MNTVHIIGIGSPLVDCLAHVSDDFLDNIPGAKGGMELIEHKTIDAIINSCENDVVHASGGSAANTVLGLSKLGLDCSFLGKIGTDKLGEFYTHTFSGSGVNVDKFKYCDSSPTGRCLSMITPDSERTCRTYLGAAMNLSPNDIDEHDFNGCSHAHVEGYLLFNRDLTFRVLECAKNKGCTISLDLASFEVVNGNRDILDGILKDYIDYVFANDDESKAFCGSDDLIQGVSELGDYCELAVVKAGAEGSIIKHKDTVIKIEADKVKAVDTTGAGDLWLAGFLYGFFNGWALKPCGLAGSRLGAEVVQQTGTSIPDIEWDFLKEELHSLKLQHK